MTLRTLLALLILLPLTAQAKLKVVATLPDLAALAAEVIGDDGEVMVLAAPNQDPHYVDGRPSYILALNQADLLLANGLELEIGWLPPLQVAARNPKIQTGAPGYFDASGYVHRLEVPTGKVDRAQGDIHGGGNPHFTHDPRAMAHVALGLGERLAQLDGLHAADYRKRATATARTLEQFAAAERARFDTLPTERRRVISYHASFAYLYDWLGLQQADTVEPRPGIKPSPAQISRLLKRMRSDGLKLIIQEAYYPKKTSTVLAKLAKAQVVVVPGGARFNKGERYLDRVKRTSEEIYNAISR